MICQLSHKRSTPRSGYNHAIVLQNEKKEAKRGVNNQHCALAVIPFLRRQGISRLLKKVLFFERVEPMRLTFKKLSNIFKSTDDITQF